VEHIPGSSIFHNATFGFRSPFVIKALAIIAQEEIAAIVKLGK
jgi:hypothetical protein